MLFKKGHIATLEHVNISVKKPDETAKLLCQLFNWKIRWSGNAMDSGYTVHVGNNQSYLALYTNPKIKDNDQRDHAQANNLNHIGIVVEDLDAYKAKATELGLIPNSFRDYKYCNSFYVEDKYGLELEIISYRPKHYELAGLLK